MPRHIPSFDSALLNQALQASAIVGAGELAHSIGAPALRKEWKIGRLEALYELAFLRVFGAWEMYLEGIFYRSLCGYASKVGQERLIRGSYYPDLATAEAAVLGTRQYLLWHDPRHVIARCQQHILSGTGGGPCLQETTITSNLARLGHFSSTRHRIVHTHQRDAKTKFDAATMHLAGRTYSASRPGRFLRDYDTTKSPPQRWLLVMINELNALLAQMV